MILEAKNAGSLFHLPGWSGGGVGREGRVFFLVFLSFVHHDDVSGVSCLKSHSLRPNPKMGVTDCHTQSLTKRICRAARGLY